MTKFLRYDDLVALGLFRNRTTLQNWIADRGFPGGRLIGGNRLWTETEVLAWVKRSSKTAKRQTPRGDWIRGRPRKATTAAIDHSVLAQVFLVASEHVRVIVPKIVTPPTATWVARRPNGAQANFQN